MQQTQIRTYLDSYTVREVTARLPELLSYDEPIVVTHTRRGGPWVLVPADFYDTLIAAWAGINNLHELRRQSVEPLPPMSV